MNLDQSVLQPLAWALLHFLWQGCAIWLVTLVALRLTRTQGPQVRYLIACAGLALCLLAPVATFVRLRPALLQQMGDRAVVAPEPLPAAPVAATAAPVVNLAQAAAVPRQVGFLLADHLTALLRCWLLGSLMLAVRFGGGWFYVLGLRRGASPGPQDLQARLLQLASRLGYTGHLRVALSARISTPMVVGWLRPVLLVPVGLLVNMDPVGLEALLVHELAHVRRHDYFVNVGQCLVEILLFYHPAVWWLSRRIRNERELCCDDAAVAWCADPILFAETLTRLSELRSETLAPALAAGGGDLMFRIKRLLLPPLTPSSIPARLNLLALACSMTLLLGAGASLKAMQVRAAGDDAWALAGSDRKAYVLAADPAVTHNGKPSQSLTCASANPTGFGTMMQSLVPAEYLGKRVRMSAWVKTAKVSSWAGLWMRVDNAVGGTLAFDNMGQRPIRGSVDWTRYEVVLDVAPEAKSLSFGLILDGPGQVWLSELQFASVDASVAVTDTAGGPSGSLPADLAAANWFLAGSHPADYWTSVDPKVERAGQSARLLASRDRVEVGEGFGTLMQMFKGKAYLGKRVRLSAWVKAEAIEHWAGLWMRVDDPTGNSTAFDNMSLRPIKGTLDWQRYEVVLDVAPDASALALGILVNGKGKVWMQEPTLEIVAASVPVTDMKKASAK